MYIKLMIVLHINSITICDFILGIGLFNSLLLLISIVCNLISKNKWVFGSVVAVAFQITFLCRNECQ